MLDASFFAQYCLCLFRVWLWNDFLFCWWTFDHLYCLDSSTFDHLHSSKAQCGWWLGLTTFWYNSYCNSLCATIGDKCWANCWKQDYFSQMGCSCKIPSPLLPHSMLNKKFHPRATLYGGGGGGGCGWRFWLVVYRHLSWIYVFYEFSQEVLSPIRHLNIAYEYELWIMNN